MASSSPRSADDATRTDTPSTNLTAFSPETAYKNQNTRTGNQPKFGLSIVTHHRGKATGGHLAASGDDVFLNAPAPTSGCSQLSPAAQTFTPGMHSLGRVSTASTAPYLSTASAQNVTAGAPVRNLSSYAHGIPAVSQLVATSVPEEYAHPYSQRQATPHAIGPIRQPTKGSSSPVDDVDDVDDVAQAFSGMHTQTSGPFFHEFELEHGKFTIDEQVPRAFLIAGVDPNISPAAIGAVFSVHNFPSLKGINATELVIRGIFVVAFSDIRDAVKALRAASYIEPSWRLIPMTPKFYVANTSTADTNHVSDYEGQLLVSVFHDGRASNVLAAPVLCMLHDTLAVFGEVKAIHARQPDQPHVRDFQVEYFDTRHAETAFESLNRFAMGDFVITVERHAPDLDEALFRPRLPREQLSMTGRSTLPGDEYKRLLMTHYDLTEAHIQGPPRHQLDYNINHNHIGIARIQGGLDVRTTIMLRNIPNKIDQSMLKAILDETSFGCYDFMYLRIDFANNCNVGYAFINFTDALAIIPFARARSGQRWNRFNSDKVAEISYATIQGKDCLVQKFRNSSVMLEHPTFRPKLFTTGSGPDAGQEEKFPGPDNPSKMRRSVENAEHVGLFAPRQGQAYREEQRRRRSQFDRGTPGAQIEDYTHHLHGPTRSPISASYAGHPFASHPAHMQRYNPCLTDHVPRRF